MAVVAGIDEAGYGPLLGPLVVGATAFRVADSALDADLWERLSGALTRSRPGKSGRLHVADSKQVHRGPRGFLALEENLLPFLELLGPCDGAVLQRPASGKGAKDTAEVPWRDESRFPLPRQASVDLIRQRTEHLRESLAEAGVSFCAAQTEVLDVPQFNREVRQDGLKSIALARRVARLMQSLWDRFGHDRLHLFVDKQGGRNSYRQLLRATFSEARLRVLVEGPQGSEYELSDGHRSMRIRFEPRADEFRLPVALASMLSKYTRELFMEMFNDFWCRRVPGLRPTAGYFTDGRRFLAQIEQARAAEGIALELLARSK